ncbi:PREDICTED: RNA polymerase II elongation factor ELL2-like [Chinchilla lanigera]|uniref:RNA polymerase II elongation factor ELL2-like n=1 Tax=Chinchilla lanigera TaxID=34839 RepID=UPI00038F04F4|nr:PREDICTED: RNA polymerase II elongation factor ELL2-like [Chinchilla lanigera]
MASKKAGSIQPGQHNVTRLSTGLTGSVTQQSSFFQNPKNALPSQVSPELQKLPGLSKVSPNDCSTGLHSSSVQLSIVNYDNHQNRTDHPQHTISKNSHSHPSCSQSIQDKMTVSRANRSHEMTAERASQTAEKFCNKWQHIRKTPVQNKVPVRKAPKPIIDPAPIRKRTAPINPAYTVRKSRGTRSVLTRPCRDRVLHLLALKDYSECELLIRLEKDSIKENEKNSLANILHEVANWNSQNCSYSLKDSAFTEVQRDWPGYNEAERQTLESVLSNKVGPFPNPKSSPDSSSDFTFSPEDQCFNSVGTNDVMINEFSISHLTSAMESASHCHLHDDTEINEINSYTTKDFLVPLTPSHLLTSQSPLPLNSNYTSCSTAKSPGTDDPYVLTIIEDSSIFRSQQNEHISAQMSASLSNQNNHLEMVERKYWVSEENSNYKFTEFEANIQNYSIDMMETQKADSDQQEKRASTKSSKNFNKDSSASGKTPLPSVSPDYYSKYFTIHSSKKRRRYEQDFRADYDEYYPLHCKILKLSREANHLEWQRSFFSPDSKEYQYITEKLSVEYRKIEEANPNWSEERDRCSYLYNKLTHIKNLIIAFDQNRSYRKQQRALKREES